MISRVPIDFLVDLLYEILTEDMDSTSLDELLAIPLGVHPQNTPQKKAERASTFRQMLGG